MLHAAIRRKVFTDKGGTRLVLADLSLDLVEPEIVAVIGASGCGKTTLLRLIAGLDTDFDGDIRWRAGAPPRIGMVFQEPRLLPWCSVRENLALVMPPNAAPGVIPRLLQSLGLIAEEDRPAGRLSLGMARRLAIARAFVVDPELILLDEPFASLDEANAGRARDLLLQVWHARRAPVLLITHDLLDAACLADRILVLSGTPSTISAELIVPEQLRRKGMVAAAPTVTRLRELSGLS